MRLSITVVIESPTQNELFETYGALVDGCNDIANSQPRANVLIEDLEPSKITAE